MRRVFGLPVLVSIVWAAWLGLVAAMAVMLALQVWHPHYLAVTLLLVALVVAGVALIFGGLWRLIVGPRRWRALTYLLLGLAPLLFFAGHFLYGLKVGYSRTIQLDFPLKMLVPFGESFFDLLTRFQYPVRTGGETVVMIAEPMPGAPEQVAAMDRHIKALRARLGGVTTSRRVHWVRGSLMGIGGHAIYGMCMGSRPGEQPAGADGLAWLDRHEVAHCVLSSFMYTDIEPPSVLTEGWAQANQGDDEKVIAVRAWESREQGQSIPLRELTGPLWYNRHHWPAYIQGAALVNHILRKHGPERFLDLFRACRLATFAADCQRVLGVSLDELDAAYWADVKKLVGDESTPVARLRGIKTRPPVDPAAWNAFLDEYLAAARTLIAPYDHVSMTIERTFSGKDEHGKPETITYRIVYRRSGDLIALRGAYPDAAVASLATPGRSFIANRKDRQAPWEIVDRPRVDSVFAYRRVARHIAETEPVSTEAAILLAFAAETHRLVDATSFAVTQLERFIEAGRPCLRVRIEDTAPNPAMWRSLTVVLAADDKLAARSYDTLLPDGSHLHQEFSYDHDAGTPILRSSHFEVVAREGKSRYGTTSVIDRRFGPVPPSEFTEERLLDGPVVHKPAPSDDELFKDPVTFAELYRVTLGAGFFALTAGLVCGFLGGFRRRPTPELSSASCPAPGTIRRWHHPQ
jgi:hypothetical protein